MSAVDYSIKNIENVITGIDGEIKNINICRLTAPGENFTSLVLGVDFQVEKNGKTKIINVVAKRLPSLQRLNMNAVAMTHEIKWYSQIAPLIRQFGDEYEIDTDFFPEYLGSRLSMDFEKTYADEDSVLLLKNFKPDGHKNVDRHIGFDYETAKAFLRVLATFHSIPLGIKYRKPEQFEIIRECLDSLRAHPEAFAPLTTTPTNPQGGLEPLAKTCDIMLGIPACQPYRKNIENLKANLKGMVDIYFTQAEEPWSTMIHNDSWSNNIMVKPRGNEKEPSVKMVDFQICTYSSFAKDVVFFLLTSVEDDVQKEHFDALLRYYYEQLTSKLEKFSIPELQLSYVAYLEELKKVARDCEVGHAIYFTHIIFADKENAPDIFAGDADIDGIKYNLINSIGKRQQQKLAVIIDVCVKQDWA